MNIWIWGSSRKQSTKRANTLLLDPPASHHPLARPLYASQYLTIHSPLSFSFPSYIFNCRTAALNWLFGPWCVTRSAGKTFFFGSTYEHTRGAYLQERGSKCYFLTEKKMKWKIRKNENSIYIWINLIFKFLDSCCAAAAVASIATTYPFSFVLVFCFFLRWVLVRILQRSHKRPRCFSDVHDAAKRLCSLKFLHYLFLAGSVRWCFSLPINSFARSLTWFYILRAKPVPTIVSGTNFPQPPFPDKTPAEKTLWEIRNHFCVCHSTPLPASVFAWVSFWMLCILNCNATITNTILMQATTHNSILRHTSTHVIFLVEKL